VLLVALWIKLNIGLHFRPIVEAKFMTQSPINVTYSLEEILLPLEGKMDNMEENFNDKIDKLDQRLTGKSDF
jgi:hypothetical protein